MARHAVQRGLMSILPGSQVQLRVRNPCQDLLHCWLVLCAQTRDGACSQKCMGVGQLQGVLALGAGMAATAGSNVISGCRAGAWQ